MLTNIYVDVLLKIACNVVVIGFAVDVSIVAASDAFRAQSGNSASSGYTMLPHLNSKKEKSEH